MEHLETPSLALSTLCVGQQRVTASSAGLGWNGFVMERQVAGVEMMIGDHSDHDMVAMVTSNVMKGEYTSESGRVLLSQKTAGQLTVIPQGPVPALRLLSEAEIVYCSFDSTFMSRVTDEREQPRPGRLDFRSGLRDKSLTQILQMLTNEFEAGNPTGRIYAETLAEALALRFLYLGSNIPLVAPIKVSALPVNKLARVKDLIESSPDRDLTLELLAKEVGYSRAHFLRMFRESTGLTPHQYVLQRRIALAEKMLARGSMGLAEIAAACGFSSQAHLTLAFRKYLSVTPAEYRRSL